VRRYRICQAAAAVLLAAITSACGAARPYQYYELEIAPPVPAAPAAPLPVTILVGRVVTSHLYHDDRIVYGSGSQMGAYEYNRWAQMPTDIVQDALVTSLRATGQYRAVTRIGSSARGDYILRTQLLGFCEIDKSPATARFSISAELFDPKTGATVWTGSYSHDQPAEGKSVSGVVEAMNQNVHDGIQQLAAGIGQYFASHPPETTPAAH